MGVHPISLIHTGRRGPHGCCVGLGNLGSLAVALALAATGLMTACSETATPSVNALGGPTAGTTACLYGQQADCKPVANIVSDTKTLGHVSSEASSLTGQLVLLVGSGAKGKEVIKEVTFLNAGNLTFAAGYRIKSVRMKYTAGSPEEGVVQSLECWSADGTKRCEQLDSQWRLIVPKGYSPKEGQTSSESFTVKFTSFDTKPRSAVVSVELLGIEASVLTFNLGVTTQLGPPKATLSPTHISFPYVKPMQCAVQNVQLLNSGESALQVDSIHLQGGDPSLQLKLIHPADLDKAWHDGGSVWTFASPLQLLPGGSAEFEVKFCPVSDNKKQCQIKFNGNDSSAPTLTVLANNAVPCIAVSPAWLSFGGALLGSQSPRELTVKNCGSQELVITDLLLSEDTQDANQEFFLDQSGLAWSGKLKAPPPLSPENPLILGVNEQASVIVLYTPADITKTGDKDTGEIKVLSSAYVVPTIKLEGMGVPP